MTLRKLNDYNKNIVDNNGDDADRLLKTLQHERLYKMMKSNEISRDRCLWKYLDHYAQERSNQIKQLFDSVETGRRNERVKDSDYDKDFLADYFNEDSG